MSVWSDIDSMHKKAQREQESAKAEIEALDGWKFKGWKSKSVPGGVVWWATCSRRNITIERTSIADLVSAVKARAEEIEQAKREGRG